MNPEHIRAYTIGFRERTYSEVDEARLSAGVLGISLREQEVYPDVIRRPAENLRQRR